MCYISDFASLLVFFIGITSSAIGLNICVITAGSKKYKSIKRKKKKRPHETVLLAKSKLKSIMVLISKALMDLYISHGVFVLTNNVQKEYDEMKEDLIRPSDLATQKFIEDYSLYTKQCYHIV